MPRSVVSLVMLDSEDRAENLKREWSDTLSELKPDSCSPLTTLRKKRGRPRKVTNTMATSTVNPTPTIKYSPVTKTVFDLATFDDVRLTKEFVPPTEPKTLEDALAAVQNDQTKLLALIHKGLVAEARDAQYNDMSGFRQIGEDGEPGEVYSGKFADESQGKLINAGILTMAKLYAGGAWDSKNKDEKKALKEKAAEFIRSNPAMLASFMPQVPVAPEQNGQA